MSSVIVCPACDLVHRSEAVPVMQRTRCSRCHSPLHRMEGACRDTALSVAVSALILFVVGNLYPIVSLHINGTTRSATLVESAFGLYREGFPILCALVLLTTVCAALVHVGALLELVLD